MRKKSKKRNTKNMLHHNESMSKEQIIEIYEEAYYRALKRIDEEPSDIKPIKFISAYHTKEYCLVIETTADTREYDFHRLRKYYSECSFESITIKEYCIIFEKGPEIRYSDLYRYT